MVSEKKIVTTLLIIFTLLFISCSDDPEIKETNNSVAIDNFLTNVQANPVLISGMKLGDSWRLTREKGSYWDGDFRKEFDVNWLDSDECPSYKEYWVFDRDKVMRVFKGNCYEKDWNNYSEIFNQVMDIDNKTLAIDYVYDGGEKNYTRHYHITTLSETELVLTEEDSEEDYFYQYSFRRESIN